ncbi:hypothetical protein [Streptomyces sp. NPDC127084]|uniref:hypothetical protein n=1 Tax=Streptomyces sp. NPDC127084 TaxID=3347133 RepID=UPI003665C0FD
MRNRVRHQHGDLLLSDVTVMFEADPGGKPLRAGKNDVVVGAYQNFHDTVSVEYGGTGQAGEARKCAVVLAESTPVASWAGREPGLTAGGIRPRPRSHR